MGDIPIYNLTTQCLDGTLPRVGFMDVIMGDIPYIFIRLRPVLSIVWYGSAYLYVDLI